MSIIAATVNEASTERSSFLGTAGAVTAAVSDNVPELAALSFAVTV